MTGSMQQPLQDGVVHRADWVDAEICDRRQFRDLLGCFMTGITVVATRDAQGELRAFTANSFTSVSLDPPLVLVCIAKTASSLDTFTRADTYSINILGDWQRDLASAFASRGPAKIEALGNLSAGDPPVLEQSLATLCCTSEQRVEAGDHIVLISRVRSFKAGAGQPLGYFRGGYVAFGLAEQSLEKLGVPLLVGGLLANDGRIVLCRRPGSSELEIPLAPLRPGERHSSVIRDLFLRLGIEATPLFPYSVFQEQGQPQTTMIFTVEATSPVQCGTLADGTVIAAFGEADEPWKLVKGGMIEGMLRRFFREQAAGNFGLYCDTADGGRIAPIGNSAQHWSEWEPGQVTSQSSSAAQK
ncbi:flavin reductase family protein [Hyphomicrobium sp.]|uniref:flavin reductase family protein n=1 Tax=Hyphomicrobium sp. TaxID=82 RepID=UPI001E1416BD|nr:flavin reductase family protein [Hyphomicrobium sp.]MBY0558911.1 flavin reductase family protein [Hyphomicrobium sp.]